MHLKFISNASGSYLDNLLVKGKVYEIVDFSIYNDCIIPTIQIGEEETIAILPVHLDKFKKI